MTAACGATPGSTDGGPSAVAPADPAPDTAFSGRFEAAPGVSGEDISFVISEAGQIAGATLKGFAITEVRFSRSGDNLDWDRVCYSATSVRGIIRSSIRE